MDDVQRQAQDDALALFALMANHDGSGDVYNETWEALLDPYCDCRAVGLLHTAIIELVDALEQQGIDPKAWAAEQRDAQLSVIRDDD